MANNKLSRAHTYVSKMDFFSSPLQFTLGPDDKAKRTFFGGVITIIIMGLSFSYFVYICILYFTNQIQPAISTTNIKFDKNYETSFSDDFFGFKITLDNGILLQNQEAQEGKKYLTYLVNYNYYEGQEQKQVQFNISPCTNEKLQGYLCVDKKSIIDQKVFESVNFKYYADTQLQNTIAIYIFKCTDALLQNGEECQTDDEKIYEVLYNFNAEFEVKTILRTFNTLTKEYEEQEKLEILLFDDNLVFASNFSFQNTQTQVIDGFLYQSTKIQNNLSDYKKSDLFVSKSKIFQQLNQEMFGILGLDPVPNSILQSVQYEQFTSVLAQFFGVLQSLLVFGMVCNSFSQMEIVQDILNLHLKVYYKKTALDILKSSENTRNKNYELLNQYQLFQSIQNTDLKSKIPDYTKLGLIQRLKILLFSKRQTTKELTETTEVKTYKSLLQKSKKSLDIYHLQQELLKIQMMLKLIFTAEQFAAIQICGCSLITENQNVKIENQNSQNQYGQTENTKLNTQDIENNIKNKNNENNKSNINQNNNNTNNNNNINQNNNTIQNTSTHNIQNTNSNDNNINTNTLQSNYANTLNNNIIGNDNNNISNNNNNFNNNGNNNNNNNNSNSNNKNIQNNNNDQNIINKSQNNNNSNAINDNNNNLSANQIHFQRSNQIKFNESEALQRSNQFKFNEQVVFQRSNQFKFDESVVQSHLETIELIENDETILQQYIDKYMDSNKVPQSELDKRIIQSMIGVNNMKQQKQQQS